MVFDPVLVRGKRVSNERIRSLCLGVVISLLFAAVAVVFNSSLNSNELTTRFSSSQLSALDSNVDLATLPPKLQMKALYVGTKQLKAKYDDLLSEGPLGTPQISQSDSVDLATLSPNAQMWALGSIRQTQAVGRKFQKITAHPISARQKIGVDLPKISVFQNLHSESNDKGPAQLGSRIGLDGGIKLLRSASQIMADRRSIASGAGKGSVQQVANTAASKWPQQVQIAEPPEVVQEPEQPSAEEALSAEEAQLRQNVESLEKRAADSEMSADQGLLGNAAPEEG